MGRMRLDHVSYAAEHDGLSATADRLAKLIGVDAVDGGATLVTELTYTGKLWGSGALQRILDDEVRRGKAALRQLVVSEPTR